MNVIITEITVGAATSFNHPHESYANFKPSLTLKATVEGSNADAFLAARDLQATAQKLVEDEKARILAEIEREAQIESAERDVERWKDIVESYETTLKTTDEELSALDEFAQAARVTAIEQAKAQIDFARNTLAEAQAKLTSLTKVT